MQYRNFGNLGFKVSILGFGAMRLPADEEWQSKLDEAVPLLRRGLDLGITYLDTAHAYGKGTNEVVVGQGIKGYDRSKLYITTKIPAHDEETGSAKAWREKFDLSLKRLDTPYINTILFHGLRWEEFRQVISKPGMAFSAARQAQAEGLVRHIGFSSHDTVEGVLELVGCGEFDAMLVQYNYLDRHNEPAIAKAGQRGMAVAIMGPVAGGRLVLPKGLVIDHEGALEVKTPELALRFVWSNPHVSVALSGMNTVQQIEENTASANRQEAMDDTEKAFIQELFEKNQKLADLYCTGCGYCMPCPNGVHIPENFRYMNWFCVWGMEEEARKAYSMISADGWWMPHAGRQVGLNAEACVECGECLPKCPQNIPIIDQLKETAAALGKK